MQSMALELFFPKCAVRIGLSLTGKATEVMKRQNRRFFTKIIFSQITFELRKLAK